MAEVFWGVKITLKGTVCVSTSSNFFVKLSKLVIKVLKLSAQCHHQKLQCYTIIGLTPSL